MDEHVEIALAQIYPKICYNSRIKMLNRMMSSLYDAPLKPYGLTGNQFTLLLFIGKVKTTNQKMIAEMLMINFSTVSRDLTKMDTAGWLSISKGADARNAQVSLSKKGLTLLATVLPVWGKINDDMNQLLGDRISGSLDEMIDIVKSNS